MDRLKPCPFCGSKDIKLCGNNRDSFWFRCNKCASIDSYDTERQAVRAWNKRVAIPPAYKGMTNMEVIKMLFPDPNKIDGEFRFTKKWGDRPYEPQERSRANEG